MTTCFTMQRAAGWDNSIGTSKWSEGAVLVDPGGWLLNKALTGVESMQSPQTTAPP